MADAGRIGFEPGFELEPGLRAGLERALEAVQAAMRATGLAGPVRLVVQDGNEPADAFVSCRGSAGRATVLHITLETGPTPLMPELPEWYVRVKWKEGRS